MIHVVCRAEASNRIGLGHLVRCINLLQAFPIPVEISFVLTKQEGQDSIYNLLESRGIHFELIPAGTEPVNDAVETAVIAKQKEAAFILTDICTADIIAAPNPMLEYHILLRAEGVAPVCAIGDSRLFKYGADVAVIPYPKMEGSPEMSQNTLFGLDYFIAGPAFIGRDFSTREIASKGTKVLAVVGGSDPFGVTPVIAEGLMLFDAGDVEARIILGAAMADSLKQEVHEICAGSQHIELLDFTDDMCEQFLWCDVAIVGEGNVKFEAAMTGTPAVLITQFEHDSPPIRHFNNLGCAKYIGAAQEQDSKRIFEYLSALLADREQRQNLADKGRVAVDNKGASRIFEKIAPMLKN